MIRIIKKIFLGSLILVLMIQAGCASSSKRKASEIGKEDCKECKKKSR